MAKTQNIRRQLAETGENLYINRWWSGLVTQRSPLYTPVSALGLQIIARHDTLAGGLNMELSNSTTVQRRPGFPNFCSVDLGASEWPLAFYSFKKLDGTLYPIVDTQTFAYTFGASSLRAFYPKSATAQTSFQRVGEKLFMCDGAAVYKWDGTFNWVSKSQGAFNNTTYWQKNSGTVVDSNATDPNSLANSASTFTTGTSSVLQQDILGLHPANQALLPITFSIYMKVASSTAAVTIAIKAGHALNSVASSAVTVTTAWQRFTVTGTPVITDAGIRVSIAPPNSTAVQIWGAQVEMAAAATTYVATSAFVAPLSKWGIATPTALPGVSAASGSLSPAIGYNYVFCYKNSQTGHYSTASPRAYPITYPGQSTGPQTSKQFSISGLTSPDPQADTVSIFRTVDGGSLFYFLVDVAMPASTTCDVADRPATWTYVDNNADTVLNTEIVAPEVHQNDPVAQTATLAKWHYDRMWVAVGNLVYFAGGPDTTTGVPEEAFPPANVFRLPDAVTAMVSTPFGLLVLTVSDAYVIMGQSTGSFWIQVWQRNFGVASRNCVAQDGDNIFIYTSRQQLFQIANSLVEIGYPIGDQLLANFPAASSYLAVHRNGADCGLFVSNNTDSIFKYSFNFSAWSPVAQPVGGVGAVASVETSAATYTLVAGRTAGAGKILGRNVASFVDGTSSSYAANVIVGSLVLAPPGETSHIEEVLTELTTTGSYPTVAVLLNEITGSFVTLPNPVTDPVQYAGTAYATSSLTSKRHYLKGAGSPLAQLVRHLQIKLTFATEAQKNELLGLAIQ